MGYGRRKRSVVANSSSSSVDGEGTGETREVLIENIIYPNGTWAPAGAHHALKGWETDLALRVAMPGEYFAEAHSTAIKQSIEDYCFLYLILTVALATALGVTIILSSMYCLCQRRKGCVKKSTAATIAASEGMRLDGSSLDTLMEACYPELQVLDALSRSVRQKKQRVHDELKTVTGSNVYSGEPSAVDKTPTPPRPSVKQMKNKRRPMNVSTVSIGAGHHGVDERLYWEIAQPPILPPTRV